MPTKGEIRNEIIDEIIDEIRNNKIESNSFYKTEVELAKDFHCSRQTIREVIKSLTSAGYIWKDRNGKIVINNKEWIEGFIKFNDSHDKGGTYKINSEELLELNDEISFYFCNSLLAPKYWKIERTIERSSKVLEITFLPYTVFKDVEQIRGYGKIQDFLKAVYPIKTNYALKEIEAVEFDSELQEKLDTKKNAGLLIITKYFFTNDRLGCVNLTYTTERRFTKVVNYED